MPELKSLDDVFMVLGFLVPGLVVLFVRSQFVTRRNLPHSAAVLSYFTVSIIYCAIAFPFVDYVLSIEEPHYAKALAWFSLIFVGPAALGLLLGLNVQKNITLRFLRRLGLNPVHVMPTAWDWKFGNMSYEWILVTLKDGTRFAGFCGGGSFASSEPSERDIYIQWVYDIDDDGVWISRGETGVLIAAAEIQTIEFWPFTPKEDHDGQE